MDNLPSENAMTSQEIYTQVLTLLIATIALVFSFIQLKRGRRQTNEDIVFEHKLETYKELIKSSYTFLDDAMSVLNALQDFKGSEEQWKEELMPQYFKSYYPNVLALEEKLAEASIVIPNDFFEKMQNFTFCATRNLVNGYHFDTSISIETYEKLTAIHAELISIARKDLHIDTLNSKLNYRLEK